MPQGSHEAWAAFVGLDWAAATPDVCLQTAGSAPRACFQLAHPPEAIDAWGTTRRTRCHGPPVAMGLARTKGLMVSAWRTDDVLGLCPSNPLTLARSRDACTPSRATDDPTAAARPLARRRPQRDTLQSLQPQRPARRALAQLVAHRRRVVGDTVRITHRLTRTLTHAFPHVRHGLQEQDTARCGDVLRRWPTRKAAPRARRSTLATCFRAPHVRSADVIAPRLQASTAAPPRTTDAGVIAPKALLVQALVAQLRVTLPALADVDTVIAQRAQSHPDVPLFQALPGAGPVCAPRLLVACGEPRARAAAAAALHP